MTQWKKTYVAHCWRGEVGEKPLACPFCSQPPVVSWRSTLTTYAQWVPSPKESAWTHPISEKQQPWIHGTFFLKKKNPITTQRCLWLLTCLRIQRCVGAMDHDDHAGYHTSLPPKTLTWLETHVVCLIDKNCLERHVMNATQPVGLLN